MTEDISNYSFDFKNEVNGIISELQPGGGNILFVESAVTLDPLWKKLGRRRGKTKILQAIGDLRDKEDVFTDIKKQYRKDPDFSSYQNSTYVWWAETTFHYVSIRENETTTELFGEKNKPLMRLFALYHETAHALIAGGPDADDDHPYKEVAADAYAALRLLQRFGQEALPLLSMISWNRAFDAFDNTSHLSTTVLDKIILDAQQKKYFTGLSHSETIRRAQLYASLTPEAPALSATRKAFTAAVGKSESMAQLLATTSLSSPLDDYARYILTKAAQPFFMPSGDFILSGKPWIPAGTDKELFAKARADIEVKAPALNLRNIFNLAAGEKAPAPAEALKVTLPRGQKKFIFNP